MIAKSMGIKSPTPYQWKNFAKKRLHYGMNFAYGGTGVFDTNVLLPNMTTQIDFLEKLMLGDSVYVKADLQSSLVLVTLSGNDYSHFYTTGGTAQVNFILYIFIVLLYIVSSEQLQWLAPLKGCQLWHINKNQLFFIFSLIYHFWHPFFKKSSSYKKSLGHKDMLYNLYNFWNSM